MVEARSHPDDLPAEPALGAEPRQLFEGDPQRVAPPPPKLKLWPAVLTLLVATGGAAFYFWWRGAAPPPIPTLADSAPAQPTPSADAPPAIRYPLENVAPQAAQVPLPPLAESDSTVLDGIAGVVGSEAFDKIAQRDGIVRRIVATVDNLPRQSVAPRLLPVKPIPGAFATAGSGEGLTMAADNAARYTPYVRIAEAVDAKTFAALYMRLYPLFQEAYRDLGYPNGYFNDRLVEAIDDALAAPVVAGPIKLTQPKIFYEYVDPHLEARSAGQKIMMRMGSDNAARVKAKLTQFRREIVGPHAKP